MLLFVIALFLLVSIAFILIAIILIYRPAVENVEKMVVDRAAGANKLAIYDELIKQIDTIIEETKQDEELRQTEQDKLEELRQMEQERLEQLQEQKAQLEALLKSDPDNKKIKTAIERINKILL